MLCEESVSHQKGEKESAGCDITRDVNEQKSANKSKSKDLRFVKRRAKSIAMIKRVLPRLKAATNYEEADITIHSFIKSWRCIITITSIVVDNLSAGVHRFRADKRFFKLY